MAKVGAPYKYTSQEIEQKFIDYVKWNKEQNKFYKREMLKGGERAGEVKDIELTPPLTIVGFCVFIKVNKSTFCDWCDKEESELHDVAIRVREQIELNQISGASLDLFNANIVARLTGISDKQDVTVTQQVQSIVLPLPIK